MLYDSRWEREFFEKELERSILQLCFLFIGPVLIAIIWVLWVFIGKYIDGPSVLK